MANVLRSREKFILGVVITYFIAFTSLYFQIRGLYSDDGLLPARNILRHQVAMTITSFEQFMEKFLEKPTLLWIMPHLGFTISYSVELLCVLGMATSVLLLLFSSLRHGLSLAALWLLYLSLYQIGQTFLWFQWDILLLEVGFLTILVCRWLPCGGGRGGRGRSGAAGGGQGHDTLAYWLVKWALFRLMFASGVVKLTSQCHTWWGLTALDWHYQSQCLPTPLAWYAHHLPHWLQRLSVAGVFLIEIVLPYLFFAPLRNLRLFAAYSQVFLMVTIMLSGNYNFFNLITCVMCLSCMDDRHICWWTGQRYVDSSPCIELVSKKRKSVKLLRWLISTSVYSALLYYFIKYFDLRIDWANKSIESRVAFTPAQLDTWLGVVVPYTVLGGALSLAVEVAKALLRCCLRGESALGRLWAMIQTMTVSTLVISMFCLSSVTLSSLSGGGGGVGKNMVTRFGESLYSGTQQFHLANSYGLFRRMTGIGGRPELVLEGTASTNPNDAAAYSEYHFYYKPGNRSDAPGITYGHQPRVDWQMWFAALGSYQHNPWLLNLVYKLLHHDPITSEYISHNPFPHQPPKYIKATLYNYYFTGWSSKGVVAKNWWRRDQPQQYFPPLSKDNEDLKAFLKRLNLHKASWLKEKKFSSSRGSEVSDTVVRWLDALHERLTGTVTPVQAIWGTLVTLYLVKPLKLRISIT